MIGNLSYDQVSQVVKVLKQCNEKLSAVPEEQRDTVFQEFFSVVEGYYKYLDTLVQINKDADEALKELIKN
jgi:hypothetical protein